MLAGFTAAQVRSFFFSKSEGIRRSSALTALGTGSGRAVGLLTALAGAAALGPTEYGGFAYIATTSTVASSLGVLGFAPLLTRAVAEGRSKRETDQTIIAAVTMVLALLVAFAAILVVAIEFADFEQRWRDYRILKGTGSVAVAVWTVGTGLYSIATAVIAGYRQYALLTSITILRAIAVGGVALAYSVVTQQANQAALAAGIAELTVAFATVGLLRRRLAITFGGWRRLVKPALDLAREGVPAGAASLAIQGSIWFTQSLLLARPEGYAENGGFALASRLCLIVTFLPIALATTSVSYLAPHRDPQAAKRLASKVVITGLATTLVASSALGITAPYIVRAFGPDYSAFAPTIAMMALAGIAIAASGLTGNVAVGLGFVRAWIVSDIVLATAMVTAALILVPTYGAIGAACTTLLSYGVSAAYLTFAIRYSFRQAAQGRRGAIAR